jgi:hypothetical protein
LKQMASLFFPQLSSGAIAQYPIKKMHVTRNLANLLPDGSMIVQADPTASKLIWEMSFAELSSADANALQAHFESCRGPYHAFTFLDPTDNMFANSADLTNTVWARDPQILITPGAADPNGGTSAFVLTNAGNTAQRFAQQFTVPANYQYCFSLYAMSTKPTAVTLVRQGPAASAADEFPLNATWNRIVSSGRINDPGTQFAAGISLGPGQQVSVFGLQLEAQIQPSRYRPTVGNGGVYTNCHFTSATLPVSSDAPNLFSTVVTTQTNV